MPVNKGDLVKVTSGYYAGAVAEYYEPFNSASAVNTQRLVLNGQIIYVRESHLRAATDKDVDTFTNPDLLVNQSMLDTLDEILGGL